MNITSKKKRNLIIALSLLLVATIAIGATVAYLSARTDTKKNVFTFSPNIKAELDEPTWDPEKAEDLVPGNIVPKDPQITNTSENGISEYVAMKLVFTDGSDAQLSDVSTDNNYVGKLLSLIDINWNTTDWQLANGAMAGKSEQIWVYKSELAPGATTNPIFTTVTIKDTVTPAELSWLADVLEGFNIVIDGAAVQYEVFADLAEATPELVSLFA